MSHNDKWEQSTGLHDYNQNEKRISQKNQNKKNNFYKQQHNSLNDRTMISDYYEQNPNQQQNRKGPSKKMNTYFGNKSNQQDWHPESTQIYHNINDRQQDNFDNYNKNKNRNKKILNNEDYNTTSSLRQNSYINDNQQIKQTINTGAHSSNNLMNSGMEKKKNNNNNISNNSNSNNIPNQNNSGNITKNTHTSNVNPNMNNSINNINQNLNNPIQDLMIIHNNKINNFNNSQIINPQYNNYNQGESNKYFNINLNKQ